MGCRLTGPVNDPVRVTVTVTVLVPPRATELVALLAEIVKPPPVGGGGGFVVPPSPPPPPQPARKRSERATDAIARDCANVAGLEDMNGSRG